MPELDLGLELREHQMIRIQISLMQKWTIIRYSTSKENWTLQLQLSVRNKKKLFDFIWKKTSVWIWLSKIICFLFNYRLQCNNSTRSCTSKFHRFTSQAIKSQYQEWNSFVIDLINYVNCYVELFWCIICCLFQLFFQITFVLIKNH